MSARKKNHLDRILGRIDNMDTTTLAILAQRLARERSLLEAVFNTIQEGILVVDGDGVIDYSNRVADRLIGLTPEDQGQAVIWKRLPMLAKRLLVTRGGRPGKLSINAHEIEITYPEHRFVRLHMVPLDEPDETQGRQRSVIILLDITEDKQSTEERIESERLTSLFTLAAGVAHEIGNPLNSIHIHLQLIQRALDRLDKTPSLESISNSVGVCSNEVERLDGIITHFLQAIRPMEPDLTEINAIEVLAEVLTVQKNELEDLGVRVQVDMGGALPLIRADRNQLKQVFFNVTKNAMEAMDTGGLLRILARSDDNDVFLDFIDTGKGINQEDMAHVFEPYFTTKKDGHGLGMMVVQRIMRAHGGGLSLASTPGTGATVTLQFPRKDKRFHLLESNQPES